MRSLGLAAMWVLAIGVSIYAIVAYGFRPLGSLVHPDMRAVFDAHRFWIYSHVFASVFALALGPLQFSVAVRTRNPSLHRWVGRAYLGIGVLVGGVTGLYMAALAFGGPVGKLGFAGLALGWLYTGAMAYRAIRVGDVAGHRAWMIRNFSLTFAAVMIRLYLPIASALNIPFETAYPVIAWLCWLPNLIIAECLVRRMRWPARALP